MVRNYVEQFVTQYGLKNGIVLSEVCKAIYNSNGGLITHTECLALMPFLTQKQIRTAMEKLVDIDCLNKETKCSGFKRETYYGINGADYHVFLKEYISQKEMTA